MRLKRVIIVVVVFMAASFLVSILLFNPFSQVGWVGKASRDANSQVLHNGETLITHENQLLGTSKWTLGAEKGTSSQIQVYASAPAVNPGQSLSLYVSTHDEGTRYTISIYRMGWYGGYGARLMMQVGLLPGHVQGYYDTSQHTLVNCATCLVDSSTGLVEANWHPSYTFQVPTTWTTGLYLAKVVDEHNYQMFVPFDVRGNTHARYVVVTPDTTYQAYNNWGGYSLYEAEGNSAGKHEDSNSHHGVKVSFDRPYTPEQGTTQVLDYEIDAIRWLERQGYDLSYISDVDLHEHPRWLLDHQAYLSLGHDEYWTREMRDGVEYARDHGVGLAFMGADAAYWQMRFEPDSAGRPDRTIVCYKVSSIMHTLEHDPLYGKDNTRVTSQWRDPVVNRPENALLGVMFSGYIDRESGFPWRVNPQANSPLLQDTGLQNGKEYGCGLVGYEWDHAFNNGFSPGVLHILGTSSTRDVNNKPDYSNTTYYIAPSGAFVFASGSIYWELALDDYRFHPDPLCPGPHHVIPGIQRLMSNIMAALVVHHRAEPGAFVVTATPTASTSSLNNGPASLQTVPGTGQGTYRQTTRTGGFNQGSTLFTPTPVPVQRGTPPAKKSSTSGGARRSSNSTDQTNSGKAPLNTGNQDSSGDDDEDTGDDQNLWHHGHHSDCICDLFGLHCHHLCDLLPPVDSIILPMFTIMPFNRES